MGSIPALLLGIFDLAFDKGHVLVEEKSMQANEYCSSACHTTEF